MKRADTLFSQAMIAPDRAIRIPLNESKDEHSQIGEFLREYNGEGIQHLALSATDIFATVKKLRARGVALQDTPRRLFELVDSRVPTTPPAASPTCPPKPTAAQPRPADQGTGGNLRN